MYIVHTIHITRYYIHFFPADGSKTKSKTNSTDACMTAMERKKGREKERKRARATAHERAHTVRIWVESNRMWASIFTDEMNVCTICRIMNDSSCSRSSNSSSSGKWKKKNLSSHYFFAQQTHSVDMIIAYFLIYTHRNESRVRVNFSLCTENIGMKDKQTLISIVCNFLFAFTTIHYLFILFFSSTNSGIWN